MGIGKILFGQARINGTGVEKQTPIYQAAAPVKDDALQARLAQFDKRERPPVVPNRVICTA
ncbi:hypothetical protein IJ579_04990 [bacterium]|nr:hypothetical protein [bacterium]